jgi:hypothetical protein
MVPGTRRVLVAMASFPAPLGAGHFGAAERVYLLAELADLAGRYGTRRYG